MRRIVPACVLLICVVLTPREALAADPETTVRTSDEILREQLTIPGKRIPESLLAQAHGVAIIPNVIKIGFVAALRRGHGVVMVRGADNNWTLPQFVTLTGGSLGWQAGVQDTDVILVFMTKKSVDGLLEGKFTIGADASAAAGPVGRNAAAATDARLKAEILSYSRSRGLFAGVSLDGSMMDMNPGAFQTYYGVPLGQQPAQVPESAMKLLQDLTQATVAPREGDPVEAGPLEPIPGGQPTPAAFPGAAAPLTVRQQLAASSQRLDAIVDPAWRKYLALPKEVYEGNNPPPLDVLQKTLTHYERVMQTPQYQPLTSRGEFQSTYGLLRHFTEELANTASATAPTVALPPPPTVAR